MIHAVLTGDFSHALETLLAVSVLLGVVLMLRRPVARQFGAGVAYLLWAIPVARFFLPPLTTPVSVLNLDPGALLAAGPAAARVPEPAMMDSGPMMPAGLPDAPAAAFAGLATEAATLTPDPMSMAVMACAAVWAGGAVFFAARSLIAHRRFMQTVDREAMPVPRRMADVAGQIAAEAGLRRPPRIVASLISRGPFVTGLLRPVVVMPAWFEGDYTLAEARAALAHELTHVRRGDVWALQASELLVAAMWFNPLVYIARDAFRTDLEAACDADVLRRCETSPYAYGATLVKAARLHLPEPALAAAHLPLTHALKERLTRMSYPAPCARRRLIGFGAALLFGASTLALTASVAVAGEPETTGTREIRVETDSLRLGRERDDRQIVLLGDPMAKIMPMPETPAEVTTLQTRITADVSELTGPEVLGATIDMTQNADFIEITRLSTELAGLGTSLGVASAMESLSMDFSNMSEAEIEAWATDFEARMESRAADIEARAADMEYRMEIHANRLDERMTAETEARALALEHRIEANAAEIARIMDERFGPEFEARVEAQAQVIEDLVSTCEAASLSAGETRVLERKDADGEVVRLACVEGGSARLKAAETLAAVDRHPGITAAEKAAFKAASEGARRKHVAILRTDAPAPPPPSEPPAAPEPPLKGE